MKIPTSPVLPTWVPPQSSRETVGDLDDADPVAVFLAEERHRAEPLRLVALHLDRANVVALLDPVVDHVLDVGDLLGGERGAVGEVEAELVGAHRRARLSHVGAQPRAQSGVQQVRGRVVSHRRVAGRVVDLRLDAIAWARQRAAHAQGLVVADAIHVDDARLAPVPGERAGVGDLAAALRVERALLELDQALAVLELAGVGDTGRGAQALVADEPALGQLGDERDHGLVAVRGGGGGPGAGALALLLHQLLKAVVVDREALLGEQLLRQVVGEPVGVVEEEGLGRVDPGGLRLLRLGDQAVEHLGAAVEGAAEALLLVVDPAHDRRPVLLEVRMGVGRDLDRALGEAAEVGRLEAEHAALLDRAAHDPPQDVAPVLVGGNDAVGEQLGHAARVIGEDPHRPGGLRVGVEGTTGELLGEIDQGAEALGLVDGRHVLLDRRHPLEPEAGVDVSLRQLGERVVGVQLVGHEDVVPVLEVALGVVAGPVLGPSERLAAVDVHLRARPAGPGRAGLPEVLGARQPEDPLLGDALGAPELDRLGVRAQPELLVAAEDGDPDLLGIEPEALGRELPAEARSRPP